MRKSTYNSTLVRSTIEPAAHTASVNGTAVDSAEPELSNFRSAMLVVSVGVVTDGTHVFTLEESDDNATWDAVAAEYLQGSAISVSSANDQAVYELGYTGHARYLRAVATVSGSPTTGGVYGAVIAMSDARRMPVPRS